jgi:hypothetical protein
LFCFYFVFKKRADEREKTVKCFVERRQPHSVSLKIPRGHRPSFSSLRSFIFVRRTYWPILSLAAIVPVPGITFQSLEAIFPLLFIITAKSPSAPERATTVREREKP